MKRRVCLQSIIGTAYAFGVKARESSLPIQLHVDLSVDPKKEKQMLQTFHHVFCPAAKKQPGFIDVKILKLRSVLGGAAPKGSNYRFELTFASEEQRQAWVASKTHQEVWPAIEDTLTSKSYNILLFDEA